MATNPTTFWTNVLFVITAFSIVIFYIIGRKNERKDEEVPVFVIIMTFVILFIVFMLISRQIDKTAFEVRRQLDQLIISKEQGIDPNTLAIEKDL